MINTQRNIILKQSVNFQFNGKTDAFALQQEVSDWCHTSLIPEIEQQLDLFDMGDAYLSIDKLVINATVNNKNWQQQIRDELISNLNYKLKDYKPAAENKITNEKPETRSHKLDELILFFFEKGYLPWWSKAFVQTDFNTVLLNWISEDKTQARCTEILLRLQQIIAVPVIQRIVNQAAGTLFYKLLAGIFKTAFQELSEAEFFITILLNGTGRIIGKKRTATVFNEVLLTMLIKNKGSIDVAETVQLFHTKMQYEKSSKAFFIKSIDAGSADPQNQFVKAWQRMVSGAQVHLNERTVQAEKNETEQTVAGNTKETSNSNGLKKIRKETAPALQDGIFIENAGAVIVAAFLPRLFERLGITAKANLVKSDLAVILIQYIVTGNPKTAEHELVLPKILCGIDPVQPVDTTIRIARAQMAEADEMLKALIEHWSIVKGTSVDGLRESFLGRSGKLIQADDEWLLQAEQKAYDMLLQQLPWSISLIKLPWMKNILRTEWV